MYGFGLSASVGVDRAWFRGRENLQICSGAHRRLHPVSWLEGLAGCAGRALVLRIDTRPQAAQFRPSGPQSLSPSRRPGDLRCAHLAALCAGPAWRSLVSRSRPALRCDPFRLALLSAELRAQFAGLCRRCWPTAALLRHGFRRCPQRTSRRCSRSPTVFGS